MTGKQLIDYIQRNKIEDCQIYVEVKKRSLFGYKIKKYELNFYGTTSLKAGEIKEPDRN